MRFWRNCGTEHVETEPTNKSVQAEKDAQSKKTKQNTRKLLYADNKTNELCSSYLQPVEMLSKVPHELFSQLFISQ